MKENLAALLWSLSELGSGLEALARKSELQPLGVQVPHPPSSLASLDNSSASRDALSQWIESAGNWLGLEAEPSAVRMKAWNNCWKTPARPCCKCREMDCQDSFFFCREAFSSKAGHIAVLAPDLRTVSLRLDTARTLLCCALEETAAPEVDRLLDETGIPEARRGRARSALLLERLRTKEVGGCWQLRQSPGATFWSQAKRAGLPRRLGTLLVAHAAEYFLLITSWWLIGRAALSGHLDHGWLLAWALILLTLVPFHVFGTWLQAYRHQRWTSLQTAAAVRHASSEAGGNPAQGVGQFLGEVMESEAVELLAVTSGFQGLTAVIELIAAEIVLTQGVSRALELWLLPLWIGLTLFMAVRYFRRRQRWTAARLSMTNDLTERMVGHRTRLAQEARQKWHEGEDEELERYLELSESTDAAAALLTALAPRGWLVLGTFGLTWAFVASEGLNIRLAISLGGILLAYRALKRISTGLIMMPTLSFPGKKWLRYLRLRRVGNSRALPPSLSRPSLARLSLAAMQKTTRGIVTMEKTRSWRLTTSSSVTRIGASGAARMQPDGS